MIITIALHTLKLLETILSSSIFSFVIFFSLSILQKLNYKIKDIKLHITKFKSVRCIVYNYMIYKFNFM